ncbi:hypothetical protein I4U23_021815 [Adineta vaga]|nr:hypothetical protein I4U23_021815 [Adineta vaga]
MSIVSNLTLILVAPDIVNLNNTIETSDVQLGDLDNDGNLDLIAMYSNEMLLAIWLGRGDGTFSFLSTYRTGFNPMSLTTTYLNNDDLVDIVVSNADDNTIWFYQNIGGGIMLPLSLKLSTGANTKPEQVVATDVNDDGILDYITANYYGGGISVMLGGPNLTFTLIQSIRTSNFNPVWLIVTHFNNDAHFDLGVANGGGSGATGFAYMAGFGNGSFAIPVFYNTDGVTQGIAAGDFNTDGNVDVALVNNGKNSLAILFGNGLGIFSNVTLYKTIYAPVSIVACDANRDGFLDLYVVARGGSPDGIFTLLFKNTNAGALARSRAVGDLNGDGILDVIVGNDNSNIIRILLALES